MEETALRLIIQERVEQVQKHGRTIELDRQHNSQGQLKNAAITLLEDPLEMRRSNRPANWDPKIWDHMCQKPYPKRLVIAAALLAAEIDRIKR